VEQIRKALEKAHAERSQSAGSSAVGLPEPEPEPEEAALATPTVGLGALRAVRGRVSADERAIVGLTQRVVERDAGASAGFPARVSEAARPSTDGQERVEQRQPVLERSPAVSPPMRRIPESATDATAMDGRDAWVDDVPVIVGHVTDAAQDAGAERSSLGRGSEGIAAPPVGVATAAGTAQSRSARAGVETHEAGPIAAADVECPPAGVGSLDRLPGRFAEIQIAAHSVEASVAPPPNGESEHSEFLQARASPARSTPVTLDPRVLEQNRVLTPNASGPAAAAFRLLRTQVLMRMRERGWRTIGIASARSADGKTTVAANLAMTIAADPRHTALLVDLDLRRPGVRTVFGLSPSVGVAEVLAGSAPIAAALTHPSSIARLRLLPARVAVQHSSSIAAGAECRALVSELRDRYLDRVILFDMPPVLEADEAVTLSALFDCLLFVVSEGRTAREDLARALALVKNTPVVGTVLNRSIEAVHSEAYG
jgi:protein-tyrosine kinase